jgi:hypothetical protein
MPPRNVAAVASEVALSDRAAVSLLVRAAASSFDRASAGSAPDSEVVSLLAQASSEGRGRGGGVVGHRRRSGAGGLPRGEAAVNYAT